jgi:PAS domain S-box-containing protein
MNGSNLNKSALGATVALGLLILVALLSYHRLGEMAAAATVLSTGLVALVIQREMNARRRAELELLRAQDDLEDRVNERTAELNAANVALQAEVLERQRVENALRHAHDELEIRVAERTRALADANEVLQREIVERRRTGEALKNSRALYHSLVENLPVNIWRTDAAGRFTFANGHLCQSFGIAQEEILGKTAYEFFTTATAERSGKTDRQVMESGHAFEGIEEFETKSGRTGFMQILKTPFHDSEGRMLGIQGISWDVTERKRAEEEMRRIQGQVERTNSDLRRKNDEIQNFYHTLSHELKTPLTSAREFISIVIDGLAGGLNDTQREYLRIAMDSCNQLRVCINDLLDATRLETGKLSIELKPTAIGELAQRVVTTLLPAATGKRIKLSCDVETGLAPVELDDSRITQVITNLVNNALKFTEAGGEITVSVGASAEKENFVEVSVTDTGRGIPDTQTDRIFDRLYQVKTGDASTEQGVGLGLFICRELVRLHGGDICVESTVGKGSTFTFELPMKAPEESRSNLLLVDDDPAMREILSSILQRAKFDVATAEDGKQALLQIRKHVPDVILMDLEMPGMDGPTTLQEIRREWGALPVVLHTGHVDGPLLSRALEWAPFTVLSKPCPMEQLVQTMRGVDRRRSGETEHKTNPQASPTPTPGKAKEPVSA